MYNYIDNKQKLGYPLKGFLGLDIGGNGGNCMKRRTRINEDRPSDKAKIIPDFLPPPEKLIFPCDTTKVTIYLDSSSVEFFKKKARKIGTKYQRMMREVLRRYAQHHAT